MRNTLVIAWRDIRSVFVSPIAYVVLTGFLLLAGWFFFNLLGQFNRMVAIYSGLQGYDTTWLNLNDAVIAPLLQNLSVVLLIVVPMLTMRSFAEERSAGTYELLFTSRPSQRGRLRGVRRQARDLPITRIGVVTKGNDVLLRDDLGTREMPRGYEHWAAGHR